MFHPLKTLILAATMAGSAVLPCVNAQTADDVPSLAAIYDNVLLPNSKALVGACENMQSALKSAKPADLPLRAPFTELVSAWKKVEASYIIGYIDVDAIDYPILVDMFHMGNENINTSLDRALKSDSDPKTALFKNAYKTVGALEYLLFKTPASERQIELARVATDNLCHYFGKMETTLASAKADYLDDFAKSTALLLNGLIESIYKTREWRVGDAAGLSRKYSNQPDLTRAEYYLSNNSLAAIRAILATHEQIIGADNQPNLATLAINNGAEEAITLAQKDLKKAIALADELENDKSLTPEHAKALFDALSALQADYYQHLVKSLNVVAKILEADGD